MLVTSPDFAELARVASLRWVLELRGLLVAHPLFSALLEEEFIPPASSDIIMDFLRHLMDVSGTIPGKSMILQSVSKCAASIKCEAEGMGAALSQNMIDDYYERFNTIVARVLSLAELQKTVLGFPERAPARQFAELKTAALQLCPTYVLTLQ